MLSFEGWEVLKKIKKPFEKVILDLSDFLCYEGVIWGLVYHAFHPHASSADFPPFTSKEVLFLRKSKNLFRFFYTNNNQIKLKEIFLQRR